MGRAVWRRHRHRRSANGGCGGDISVVTCVTGSSTRFCRWALSAWRHDQGRLPASRLGDAASRSSRTARVGGATGCFKCARRPPAPRRSTNSHPPRERNARSLLATRRAPTRAPGAGGAATGSPAPQLRAVLRVAHTARGALPGSELTRAPPLRAASHTTLSDATASAMCTSATVEGAGCVCACCQPLRARAGRCSWRTRADNDESLRMSTSAPRPEVRRCVLSCLHDSGRVATTSSCAASGAGTRPSTARAPPSRT